MRMRELGRVLFSSVYATLSGYWSQSGLFKYPLNPLCVYSCCPPQDMDGLHTDEQVEPFPHPVSDLPNGIQTICIYIKL